MRRLAMLLRPRLSVANGMAAAGGYLLGSPVPGAAAACAALTGVTLLAAGGSALNQVMEMEVDALMDRTRRRPLPAGTCSPMGAALIALLCIAAGAAILGAAGGEIPAAIGLSAVAWYLGIYTPLKRRTPAALLLGAVCGTLAPAVGWSMSGQPLTDQRLVLLIGIFYLWQVPHFWLVQRRHPDDCRRAGLPVFPTMDGPLAEKLYRLWVLALASATVAAAGFGQGGTGEMVTVTAVSLILGTLASSRWPAGCAAGLNLFPPLAMLAMLLPQ